MKKKMLTDLKILIFLTDEKRDAINLIMNDG